MLRFAQLATLAAVAAFGACGSSTPPPTSSSPTSAPPAEPTASAPTDPAACPEPAAGEPMTPDQCTCLGGRVNPSRGGEQEHCAANEQELGTVRLGIEGGWCCK